MRKDIKVPEFRLSVSFVRPFRQMRFGIAIATLDCESLMGRHMTLRIAPWYTTALVALAVGLWSTDGRGQSQSRAPRFRAGVDLVSVDVCVRDASGRFLPDLSAGDFRVLENGIPQHIEILEPSSAVPLTAVLLIDVSYSMSGAKLARALDAAGQFAALLRSDDRLAIIAFNRQAKMIHGFADSQTHAATGLSSDIAALMAWRAQSTGSTALYDALLVAVNQLTQARRESSSPTREVVVLLSDGEDTSSRVGFEEVRPVLRRSGALTYSVSLRVDGRGQWTGPAWPMLALAQDTGARAVGVSHLDRLPEFYREIVAEVRHLYRIGYVSSDSRSDGQWRAISVRVPARDARVRARAGYYASQPAREARPPRP
jgi:Ca-activated chloride channel family protein